MPKKISKIMLLLFVLASFNLYAAVKETKIQTNLHCESCKAKIEKNLSKVDGIISSNADVATKIVTVKFEDSKINETKIKQSIADLGYKADNINVKEKDCCNDKSKCTDKKTSANAKSCCDTKATKSNPNAK